VSTPQAQGLAAGRTEAVRFARFVVVGGIGFAVDAGVLTALLHATALGPYLARVVSFGAAVVCTYLLNRNWTFASRQRRGDRLFLSYLATQIVGALINYCVYAAVVYVTRLPPPTGPLIALTAGSALALIWNYASLRWFVFGGRR